VLTIALGIGALAHVGRALTDRRHTSAHPADLADQPEIRPGTEAHRAGQAISFGSSSRVCDRLPAMTELGAVAWPVDPIKTERLVLRESEARDRAAFIELFASADVHTYLGGPQPRDELERSVPETPGRRPGLFVIELDGAMIGTAEVSRRAAERRGNVRPDAGEAELSYLFLPEVWGRGYATEACAAALDWFADAFPGVAVVLYTQTANVRSMRLAAKLGFTEVKRFEKWDAEQWMGEWSPVTPPA
jgi:RimJ/RimL family protein N-acetyltransferase